MFRFGVEYWEREKGGVKLIKMLGSLRFRVYFVLEFSFRRFMWFLLG